MKKIILTLDDELAKRLATEVNRSEFIRKALRAYIFGDIPTDTIAGIRDAYRITANRLAEQNKFLKELDSKLDYIAKKV